MGFETIDEVPVDPAHGRVYEHGWQSWSPSTTYRVDATSHRPGSAVAMQTMCYRPERPGPPSGFQGEGLLAIDPGDGSQVRLYAAADAGLAVPSISSSYVDGRLIVTADAPTTITTSVSTVEVALAAWADGYVAQQRVPAPRAAPTAWCSWYHYFTDVTEADVLENVAAIAALDLPVDVIQIDDGWQSEIGDWLTLSDRFASLPGLTTRIRDTGRRPGVWLAPFLVGARSTTAREHRDWLIGGPDSPADAGHNWGQDLYALDLTHPDAAEYISDALHRLLLLGFDYFKLDFLYAGALDGRRHDGSAPLAAYRAGMALIREAVGPSAYLLGSGAPILPSAGLVDAMRVSPDIDTAYEPAGGDFSRPSQHAATLSTVGRAFMHGRFWVNDSDCLIARPAVQRREDWAAVVERYGGLRTCSDRIADLDDWGLHTTRRLLGQVPPPTPLVP